MPTYAIGDIQGCYKSLQSLLDEIGFHPDRDRLWLVGDLVNRGPDSLSVMRWVLEHRTCIDCVLGNHDLHLLAVAQGVRKPGDDGLKRLLSALDATELLDWLAQCPLIHRDESLGYSMVHAGLPADWDIGKCLQMGHWVSASLLDNRATVLEQMYGDCPDEWDAADDDADRRRFVINHYTRMRLCHQDGRPALKWKGTLEDAPPEQQAWFAIPGRRTSEQRILFGHWSALGRIHWPAHNVWCLDTGCVWGRPLTAMRLEDQKIFQIEGCG